MSLMILCEKMICVGYGISTKTELSNVSQKNSTNVKNYNLLRINHGNGTMFQVHIYSCNMH